MAQIKEYSEQVLLNAIARTRLLFKTDESLYKDLNYSKNTQNIGRIGGNNLILKKAMLAYIDSRYAKAVSQDVNLIEVLVDYARASDYISKFYRQKYFKEENNNFTALVEYFCTGRTDCKDTQVLANLELMIKEYADIASYVPSIMLLILWKIIPRFEPNKVRDVQDIGSEYEQMHQKIEKVIQESKILRRFPVLDRYHKEFEDLIFEDRKKAEIAEKAEKEDKEEIDYSESANRLRMIYILSVILRVMHNNSSPERMSLAMDEIPFGSIDICGYWEDIEISKEGSENHTVWHFESEDNCYYRVKQVMRDRELGQNGAYFRTFDMIVTADEYDNKLAMFIPTQAIKSIISDGAIPENMQFMAAIETISNDRIQTMVLSCCSDNKWFKDRKMRKIYDTTQGKKLFGNPKSWKDNVDYEFIDNAYSITEDYVYFKKPNEDLFYKIPQEYFQKTDIYELSMYKSKDCLFAGCPATLQYIDLTYEDKLERKGVSIVKLIETPAVS